MFKRPELSRIISSNTQIILHAFQDDVINPGKYLISRPRYEADISPKCDIYYKNTKVGTFVSQMYYPDQNSMFLYFHKLSNLNYDNKFAILDIDCKSLKCPSCSTYFRVGDSPCKCIEKSLFYYVSEVKVNSVNLYDITHDNIDSFDLRQNLYSKFFGGTLHSLQIMDPI